MYKNTRIVKLSDDMHHCSSITSDDEAYYVAFYYGKECSDRQKVSITRYPHDGSEPTGCVLAPKTGNPIVFNHDGQIFVIYSLFTDADETGNVIDFGRNVVLRWKHCDNYIGRIEMSGGVPLLVDIKKIDGCYGRLARCQPIQYNGKTLIPMYREGDPLCEVWEFDGQNVRLRSQFGYMTEKIGRTVNQFKLEYNYLGNGVAIQPSIVEIDGKLVAYCRNVCKSRINDNRKAWYAESKDGVEWSELKYTKIPNHNNSLVVIKDREELYFVLSTDAQRSNMLLANNRISIPIHTPLTGMRKSYSYPNYHWHDDVLNIVHTNCRRIVWHQMDREFLHESFGTGSK